MVFSAFNVTPHIRRMSKKKRLCAGEENGIMI